MVVHIDIAVLAARQAGGLQPGGGKSSHDNKPPFDPALGYDAASAVADRAVRGFRDSDPQGGYRCPK